MNNPQNAENVELETGEMEQFVVLGEALNRLMKNSDFKTVILDYYFKEKTLSAASLLSDNGIKASGKRADIMEELVAISNLQYCFRMIEHFHRAAIDPVLSDEEQAQMETEAEAEMNAQGA